MAANDDALALYGAAKTMVDAMKLREKVLDGQMAELDAKTAALSEKTAALGAVIAELKQFPVMLGNHTSHYIGEGVRKAIQDDFSRPIADAVSGPWRSSITRPVKPVWQSEKYAANRSYTTGAWWPSSSSWGRPGRDRQLLLLYAGRGTDR